MQNAGFTSLQHQTELLSFALLSWRVPRIWPFMSHEGGILLYKMVRPCPWSNLRQGWTKAARRNRNNNNNNMVNMNNVNNMKMWWCWCCKYNQYWLDIMVMIIDDDSSLRPAKFEPAFLSSLGPRANTKNWRSPWLIWTILGPHMLKSETPTPSFCEFEALPVLLRDVLSPSFPSSFPFSSFLGSPSFLGLRCRNAKSDF